MKRQTIFFAIVLAIIVIGQSCSPKFKSWELSSPNGNLSIFLTWEKNVEDKAGNLSYVVKRKSKNGEVMLVLPSELGIVREDAIFYHNFTFLEESEKTEIIESYELVTGKVKHITAQANEVSYKFQNPDGKILQIIVRAYDKGVAFRYRFPESDSSTYKVLKEHTSFHIPIPGKTWMQAYDTITMWTPAYETYWQNKIDIGTRAPKGQGWSFPMLFNTGGHWMLISESDLGDNYFGSHLQPDAQNGLYTIRLPEPDEAMGTGPSEPTSTLPWEMPWRVIMISEDLKGIVENTLITDLAKPSILNNTDWIVPGRASWSWWSDHPSPKRFEKLVKFVDLAAEMGWEYTLVDANWNMMRGGNLEQLVEYAKTKSVGVLVWYNSGGPHNNVTEQLRDAMYEKERRREEFKKLSELGVKGVKIDFFQSDKPHIIKLYHDILKDAAEYNILVNFHGCTMPRGWNRTYPHMLTLEAVVGSEAYSFASGYPDIAPWHNTILPFTRNVVGPMDYTPVAFSDQTYPHITTNCHELALSIIFESGIIHFADRVESYLNSPEFVVSFLKNVPVSWEESRFIDGYPGEYCLMARKNNNTWYVAAINGKNEELNISFALPFVPEGDYLIEIINDGEEARSFQYSKRIFEPNTSIDLTLKPYGGFVAVIRAQK